MRLHKSFATRTFAFFCLCVLFHVFVVNRFLAEQFSGMVHPHIWRDQLSAELLSEFKELEETNQPEAFYKGLQKRITHAEPKDILVTVAAANSQVWSSSSDLTSLSLEDAPVLRMLDETTSLGFREVVINKSAWTFFEIKGNRFDAKVAVNQLVGRKQLEYMWEVRNQTLQYQLIPILLLTFLFSWVVAKSLLDPMKKLGHKLHETDWLRVDQPLEMKNEFNEFGEMIDSFNQLLGKLKTSFEQSARFSSDASHELRTPLTILRGQVEHALNEATLGSDLQQRLVLISDEIDRLISIAEKLLQLSLADAGKLSLAGDVIDFSHLCDDLLNDFATFTPNLSIVNTVPEGICIQGDLSLISQLLGNLLSNAVKYNQPDGWIEATARVVGESMFFSLSNPTFLELNGMEERVFDRFFRGLPSHNRSVDGTGLGLSLCREIARAHKGELIFQVKNESVSITLRMPTSQVA